MSPEKWNPKRKGETVILEFSKACGQGQGELSILGDGLKTWKLSLVKGMNICRTQLYNYHLKFIPIITIIIAKCFLLYSFS